MQQDWNIKSRSDSCQMTGLPFEEGDFFYTLLFLNRPLSKLADVSKVQEVSGAQPRSVYGILDEASTGATQQFAAAVEFGKRSNKEEFQRLDLSESAWEERKQDLAASIPFSYWRSKYEIPSPPAPEPLAKDDAEGMLRHFLKQQDPQHANASYILALMLERKKLLRPLPSPEKTTLLYEHVGTGETFILTDPQLSLEHLAEVQHEVSELLSSVSSKAS